AEPDVRASGVERRAAVRHELDVNVVRAVITGSADGQNARGRVRNLSTTGGMLLEAAARIAPKTAVSAELTLYDGRMMIFSGRVVRSVRQELALKLDTDDSQAAFLELFIRDARSPDQRALQPVRVSVREEGAPDLVDDVALTKRWLDVREQFEDDEVQQRFIQECLKANRLEFAVARYRELKAERPNDERVQKYLGQIGTILGFYAFQKTAKAADGAARIPSSLKMPLIALGLLILAAIGLVVLMRMMAR
ncbi:PilZ domain-containing protein, partial [Myxococcota bacterium]|nr:PilZ domain-containing protein [Myxococcota bacterium]